MTKSEAFAHVLNERAMRAAQTMPLPTSADELAGMLAGFGNSVRYEITDEMLSGYLAAKAPEPTEYMGIKLVDGRRHVRAVKAQKPTLPSVLENSHVRVELELNIYGKTLRICGNHKEDRFNEPRFFTQNKRGLDKQAAALVAAFTDSMTFRDVVSFLSAQGAKVHDYCAMD